MGKTLHLILFSIFILCGSGEPAFAQKSVPDVRTVSDSQKYEKVTGVVDALSFADKEKGTVSEIVVAADSGKKTGIIVKSTTIIYDVSWKPVTFDKIAKNQTVKVKYATTGEGVREAVSIKIIKE